MGKYTIRLKGFQPDDGQLREGCFVGGTVGIVPTRLGYRLERASQALPLTVFGTAVPTFTGSTFVSSAIVETFVSGLQTYRQFFATTTQIHELVNGAWTNVGSSSSGLALIPPRFANFGNVTYAALRNKPLMSSTDVAGSSAELFTTVSGSPSATFIETVNQFVIVAKTATDESQWICSALGDPSDWTPSVTTQCATGTLKSETGMITAMKRLGDDIVIYKENAIFWGRYVGAQNNTWAFTKIPENVGCLGQDALISLGYAHVFVGENDVYMFDGTRPIALNCPLREFFKNSDYGEKWVTRNFGSVRSFHDAERTLIYWLFLDQDTNFKYAMVFNYKKEPIEEAWGIVQLDGSWCFGQMAGTVTGRSTFVPGFFKTDKVFYSLDGSGTSTGIWALSRIGDPLQFRTLKNVIPKWITPPDACTGSVTGYADLAATSGGIFTISDRTFVGGSSGGPFRLEIMDSARFFDITLKPTTIGTNMGELREIVLEFEDDGIE